MHTIAELNLLLRAQAELPTGLKLATVEFREGWSFVRPGNARRLEKKIQTCGWNFIKVPDGLLRSGVGDTSQEAIAGALKLALRRVGDQFNAAEVEHIELTKYPWFYLARVRINPYRIQPDAALLLPEEEQVLPPASRIRRLPVNSAELYPHFGSAMPQLKAMLLSSRGSEARPQ
ncbi:MAG: hypothetical protein P4K97_08895 [Terracidiphilus sp.]|nr:hypothetical protein [Terracidiphilus sp.]